MLVVREHREDLILRIRVLTRVVTVLLVLIGAGFWFVQIVQGDYYRELAENNRLRKLVADLSLDKEALQSVIRKNGWSS